MQKLLLLLSVWVLLGACTSKEAKPGNETSLSTETTSGQFKNKEEKLAFLAKYVKSYSTVWDAEYAISYHDNSQGMLPGPSDYAIRYSINTDTASVRKWIGSFQKQDFLINTELWKPLPIQHWKLKGKPTVYISGSSLKVIYPESGVVLGYLSTTTVDLEKYKE